MNKPDLCLPILVPLPLTHPTLVAEWHGIYESTGVNVKTCQQDHTLIVGVYAERYKSIVEEDQVKFTIVALDGGEVQPEGNETEIQVPVLLFIPVPGMWEARSVCALVSVS